MEFPRTAAAAGADDFGVRTDRYQVMDATQLLLIRHAESQWAATGQFQGQLDPPLSDVGRQQARLLARRLAGEGLGAVYCSDLSRAAETAALVSEGRSLLIRRSAALREVHLGDWQGLTAAQIAARYPEPYRLWRRDSVTNRPPGGERIEAVQERSLWVAHQVLAAHRGETVVIVAHSGPLRCILCGLLELPLATYSRLRLDHASLTRLRVERSFARLEGLNDRGHLDWEDLKPEGLEIRVQEQ
jgi:alpha-ribazole phosphatase